jgi:hypothetical protein
MLARSLIPAELKAEITKDGESFEKEKKDWDSKAEEKQVGKEATRLVQHFKDEKKEIEEFAKRGPPVPSHRKEKQVTKDYRLKGFCVFLCKMVGKEQSPNLFTVHLFAETVFSLKEKVQLSFMDCLWLSVIWLLIDPL